MPFTISYSGRRAWLALALLFVLSLPAVTPRIYASDEVEYFSFLRSIWFDHDVSFENEYSYFYERGIARTPDFHETFLQRISETGLRVNFGTIGCAILWAPFYAVAHLGVTAMQWAGRPVVADGLSFPYIAAVCYGSAVYAWLALLLARWSAHRLFGRPTGWFTDLAPVLAIWFGTPLFFYMYIAPPMSHAASAFAVAAFVAAWLRVRARWSARGLALLGVLAALMTMVREQDAFIAAGPALDFLVTLLRGRIWVKGHIGERWLGISRSRLVFGALVAAAAFTLTFVPQALAYLALNGRIGPARMVSRKMNWWSPHGLQVLFSPEHGFFPWTPLALVALAGLAFVALRRRGAREEPAPALSEPPVAAALLAAQDVQAALRHDRRLIAACLLLMAATQVYVAGSVESWTVAGAFGQRRFVALSSILVLGLTPLACAASSLQSRLALSLVLVLGIWWNLGLVVQFGTGMMDRQRLELGRNAYTSFAVLPRLVPELGWRYLFDRESFYKTRASLTGDEAR